MRSRFMRWIKVISVSLGLIVWAELALAQALGGPTYQTIEPSRIELGESAILRVTSYGQLGNITPPTVPGLVFERLGRSDGADIRTLIPTTSIEFRVTPQFAGTFAIPGLTPSSHAISLEVVTGDEPNPYVWHSQQPAPPPVPSVSLPRGVRLQADGAAFLHLEVPTRPIYVGEAVPVKIDVGIRPGIVTSMNGLPTLKGGDFTFNNLSKQPERREEAIAGNDFEILTWHSALAAVRPGDFSLSAETPLTAKISTMSAADRAVVSRMAWPLLQSLYNNIAPRNIVIESTPFKLKVLPLPTEGKPRNFGGAVGDFQVSSDISPASVTEGEPLTLRLHVRGAGNFDRVDSAMLDHLDHWKTYPARSSFTPSDAVGNTGEKVFEQPLIAAQPGEQAIPGLEFTYFNPDTRRYEHAQTRPIQVTVAASLASSSLTALTAAQNLSGAPTAGAPRGLRPDHPPRHAAVGELRPLYFQGPFLALPTTLALLLAGGWFAVRPNPARASSKRTARTLVQLGAAARAGDALSFFGAAKTALLQTFATRWQMPADQITAAELTARLGPAGEDVERLFSLADEARYSDRSPGDTDFQYWLRLIRGQLSAGRQ
jgi:hypothetical protein